MDITTLGYQNFPCTGYSATGEIRTNENILLFGSAGAGKSNCFARKQLQDFYGNYVVIDMNRTFYNEFAKSYEANNWDTKVIDFASGPKVPYNPFLHLQNYNNLGQFVDMVTFRRHMDISENGELSPFFLYAKPALICIIRLMQHQYVRDVWNIDSLKNVLQSSVDDYDGYHENMKTFLTESIDIMCKEW